MKVYIAFFEPDKAGFYDLYEKGVYIVGVYSSELKAKESLDLEMAKDDWDGCHTAAISEFEIDSDPLGDCHNVKILIPINSRMPG